MFLKNAFIDGGHSYQTVYNDINNVINKVKKGSIILCDDYILKGSRKR